MVSSRVAHALVLVLLMCSAPLSGCFAPSDGEELPSADDLEIRPSTWIGGEFQTVAFTADEDLSLYVPYLLRDPATNFVQNSTIVDLNEGETVELTLLAPPRTTTAVVQIGLPGRDAFPVRDVNESWATWVARGGMGAAERGPAASVLVGENTTWPSVRAGNVTGGPSAAVVASIERLAAPAYDESEGARHSTGFVNGRDTYDTLAFLSNEDIDPTDLADGAEGFLNRWAGQGNAAYEDAAQHLIQEMESFGLEVNVQRYEYTDWQGNQNPEGYNICGFRFGSVFPNEWMVFGAHFDVAPPINALALDPHVTGVRTYGTRVGAYDNTAGTSMVLEVAEAMANAATRRTMVFCLWSGEEGGKRGSDYWTDFYVSQENPDVTVTNYVNLDMAGVNWPVAAVRHTAILSRRLTKTATRRTRKSGRCASTSDPASTMTCSTSRAWSVSPSGSAPMPWAWRRKCRRSSAPGTRNQPGRSTTGWRTTDRRSSSTRTPPRAATTTASSATSAP